MLLYWLFLLVEIWVVSEGMKEYTRNNVIR